MRVFKTGPDFLDPMILARASGAPVLSLDLWMVGEAACRNLLAQAAAEADLILIEGVMGLFDGTPSSADLAIAFGEIARVMDGESQFIFDMNHPQIYPEVWGMKEPFIDEGADFHLEIATTYRRNERTGRALVTGWAMLNGKRITIHERHTQRCYEREEIVAALAAGGLEPIEEREFDPWLEGRTVKLFFVCRRIDAHVETTKHLWRLRT